MGKSRATYPLTKSLTKDEQEVALAEQNRDSCLPKGQSGIQARMDLWSQDPLKKKMEIMLKVCDV